MERIAGMLYGDGAHGGTVGDGAHGGVVHGGTVHIREMVHMGRCCMGVLYIGV